MICKITYLVSRKFGCVEKIYYLCAVFRNAKVQNLFLLTKLKPLKMKKIFNPSLYDMLNVIHNCMFFINR